MKDTDVVTGRGAGSQRPSSISTSLLLRVQGKEALAWQRLVHLVGPVVYNWCRHARLKPEDAADVGQEVFLAVSKSVAQFRRNEPGQSFRGWLWSITQRKVADFWRRRAVDPVAQGTNQQEWLEQIPLGESSDPSSGHGTRQPEGLHRALQLIRSEFEDRTWQAFWHVTVESQVPAEVAQELNMSTRAVYIAKSRVLRRLRDELQDLVE